VRLRPPERGEHTEEVLSSVGYTLGEIAEFRRKGIV
jgi:crotonobetainyl-CoA:carnitine CoA-transferase CaiB-like acyl-CoA transferase